MANPWIDYAIQPSRAVRPVRFARAGRGGSVRPLRDDSVCFAASRTVNKRTKRMILTDGTYERKTNAPPEKPHETFEFPSAELSSIPNDPMGRNSIFQTYLPCPNPGGYRKDIQDYIYLLIQPIILTPPLATILNVQVQ